MTDEFENYVQHIPYVKYMCIVASAIATLGLISTIIETYLYRRRENGDNVKLLSETLHEWVAMFQSLSESIGFWLARVVNPMFYLEKLWPCFRPYIDSLHRLWTALAPNTVPFYYFLKGFFKEYYGAISIGIYGILGTVINFYLQVQFEYVFFSIVFLIVFILYYGHEDEYEDELEEEDIDQPLRRRSRRLAGANLKY